VTTTSTTSIYEQMFRSFGLKENPFHVSPDPRFLFSGPSYETALAELMFGIEAHRGLLVLTGEAGTGKTTLMRHFLQWLKDRQFSSSYIFHSHLDPASLFEFILRDFGVPVESTRKSELLATLHRWLQARQTEGDSPVIVIDEAQALSLRTLNELMLLLNLENANGKLVQIVLAGQPELEEKLRRPESHALRQRIMVRCRLPLLSLEETGEYIASRLRGAGGNGAQVFPEETVQTIYSYARGIPRLINLLCEQALIGAYAERSTTVAQVNVRRVAAEFDMVGEPFDVGVMDAKFTPTIAAKVSPAPHSVATPEKPASAIPTNEEMPLLGNAISAQAAPATEETPVVEQAMAAAAAAQSVMPILQVFPWLAPIIEARQSLQPEPQVHAEPAMPREAIPEEQLESEPQLEPDELQPSVNSTIVREESPALDPEHVVQQQQPLPEPISDQPQPDLVVQSESVAMAQASQEIPQSDSAVPEHQTEPAPPVTAEESDAHEAQRALHIVPPREKRQPEREYAWRKHREHRSHRAQSAFAAYWRDVAESFVRDWRAFFASLAPQMSAFAGNVPHHADSFRRKVMEPLRMWLRTPINPARRNNADTTPPSAPRDKP
jgi:general secretion pathway protein A